MEEKLDMVKKMMELEKEKKATAQKKTTTQAAATGGAMWRSANPQKQITGYSQMVLQQHRKQQPNLPPTSLIMGKENSAVSSNCSNSHSLIVDQDQLEQLKARQWPVQQIRRSLRRHRQPADCRRTSRWSIQQSQQSPSQTKPSATGTTAASTLAAVIKQSRNFPRSG